MTITAPNPSVLTAAYPIPLRMDVVAAQPISRPGDLASAAVHPAAPRRWSAAGTLICAGLALLTALQLLALPAVDPLRATISELVHVPGGVVVVPLSGALTLAGSVLLTRRLWQQRARAAAAVLVIWCAGVLLAALFPTDPRGTAVISAASQIHRWAAAAMFAAAPFAGWCVARWSRRRGSSTVPARQLRRRSLVCAAAGIGQFAFSLPSLLPVTATWAPAMALFEYRGLAERVLFAGMIAVMVALCRVAQGSAITGPQPSGPTDEETLAEPGSFPHCEAAPTTTTLEYMPPSSHVSDFSESATEPRDTAPFDTTAFPPDARQAGHVDGLARGREDGPGDSGHGPRPSRRWFMASSVVLMITWPIGLALFIMWAVVVSLSIFAFIAPLATPLAALMRTYATAHRRWAGRALGMRIERPRHTARPPSTRLFDKITQPFRDPATWREWLWLPVNATAGFALAIIPVVMLLSVAFYLVYPLLYAVTPQAAFGTVFGVIEIHSVSQAWIVTPVAALCLAVWFATVRSLPLAYAKIVNVLLSSSMPGDRV